MKLTQLERIRGKLLRDGSTTRNQCLSQFPAITRLGARIEDLETKEGYVFRTENTGRDYVYHLVSVNNVAYVKPADRAQMLKENAEVVSWFDNYQPTN